MGVNRRAGLCMILVVVFVLAFAKPQSASSQNAVGEQARQVTCTGKVVDAEGRPIAGARVAFYEVAVGEIAFVYNVKLLKEATTKADGAFSFAAEMVTTHRQGVITARKEGLAIGWADWRMRENIEQDIVLGRPKELTGLVVDESGDPLAEAGVFIAAGTVGDKQYLPGPVSRQLLRTNTDAAGRFTFAGLPAGATFEFGIEKVGYATMTSIDRSRATADGLQFSPGQGDIKLVVPVEAKIAGTVVEKDSGGPVAGAAIMVRHNRMGGYFLPEPTISGADGRFEINALLPGSHTLCLAVPRNVPADWVAEPVEVTLKAAQARTDVRIEVSKGATLEVRITDAQSEQPLEKAHVSIRDEIRSQWVYGGSDNKGVARIPLLPGAYQFNQISLRGYNSKRPQEAFTIEDGQTKLLKYQLTAQPKVVGVVRDSAGKLLEGVQLGILPGGAGEINSDSEGKFEVIYDRRYWDPEETVFCLVARDEGRNLAAALEIGNAPEDLEIELGPGLILAGKVVDPNGKPIGGARLNLMLQMSNWGSSLTSHRAETDQDGSFQVRALPAGHKYKIYTSAAGYGDRRTVVPTGAVDNFLNVGQVTLPVANLAVSGRIVDVQGNPIAQANITSSGLGDGQPGNLRTHSDAEGNFTLDGVCAGKIYIRIDSERDGKRLSARIHTDGGASGLKIIVREGNPVVQYLGTKTYDQIVGSGEKVISGVAVDQNGLPVAGVPVGVCCHKKKGQDGRSTWTYSSFITLRDTTDEQGRFAIELEEDGEYNLRFSPDNHAAIIVYDVPVGRKDLKVTLPEGGTLTGRLVRMEAGKKVPIPNVQVKLEQTDRASYTHLGFDRDRATMSDAQGRFRFDHVRMRIRPGGSRSAAQWDYVPRVWQITYGDTSKTIGFYDGTRVEEVELVVKPGPADATLLTGGALPAFDGIKIDLAADQAKGRRMLVCFFDMQQRPSRNSIIQLAKQAKQLKEKGVIVVAVHIAKVDENKLNEWVEKNKIPFPVGIVQSDEEQTRFAWGVQSLPWLILTDSKHIIRAEGFAVSELNGRLDKILDNAP